MTIYCNGGTTSTNLIGELPGYGTVMVLQTSYHYSGSRKDLRLHTTAPKQFNSLYTRMMAVSESLSNQKMVFTTWMPKPTLIRLVDVL